MSRIVATDIQLGAKLGEGSFGVVYGGEWNGTKVAVKQIKRDAIGQSAQAVAEFEAEIAHMASLPYHENLVQLYGVVALENDNIGAVVEFCAHGALKDALYGAQPRTWSEPELVRVAHDAACGVAHLHRNQLVHRDIAARNVLLNRHDVAKVADFGMARAFDENNAASEQQTLNPVGPLKWMAPEQVLRLAYSKASDVFAFGVLLFEIVARETPWKDVPNLLVAKKVVDGERMHPPQSVGFAKLCALMSACWTHEPSQRPSMQSVQRELRASLTGTVKQT